MNRLESGAQKNANEGIRNTPELLRHCPRPRFIAISGIALPVFIVVFTLGLMFLPWQQTSFGGGIVIAYDPNERIQEIQSPVNGVISNWHVVEGSFVKANEPIADIVDIDPLFLDRLQQQRKESLAAYEATQRAVETSKKNLERQRTLASQGLKSQRDYEQARLEYAQLEADLASARNQLTDIESRLARQSSQQIRAPRDAVVMKIMLPQGSAVVKAGDVLVKLVPTAEEKIVEAYIPSNDMPFVDVGRKATLQFEGWPVIQVSGWPSLAVGVFEGKVTFIDPSTAADGRIRVFISPDKDKRPWPDDTFLRQGNRVKVWILLEKVTLGYEIWRRLNAFPPEFNPRRAGKEIDDKQNLFFKSVIKQ